MTLKRWFHACVLTAASTFAAINSTGAAAEDRIAALYQPYQALLNQYLVEHETESGGLVTAFRYRAAMDADSTSSLVAEQRSALADFDPESLDTGAEANAFWINAYNFFMVAHILANPEGGQPVDGVKEFGSFINPYRVFQRDLFKVGGDEYSLDDIEKGTLLGDTFAQRGWKDARVHFAVNCASVGCPPLRQSIYVPERLDEQLDANVRRAVRTDRHLRVEGNTLYLSRIFDWYEDDFVAEAGGVRAYVLRYVDDELRERIRATEDIAYIDYDWALNSPGNFPEIAVGP